MKKKKLVEKFLSNIIYCGNVTELAEHDDQSDGQTAHNQIHECATNMETK